MDFFFDHATLVAAMPGSPDVELGANEDHLEELLRKRNWHPNEDGDG